MLYCFCFRPATSMTWRKYAPHCRSIDNLAEDDQTMNDQMNYRQPQAVLALFGQGERATLRQIKDRYREAVKRHHPDRNLEAGSVRAQELNQAYRLLIAYCEHYRYDFSEAEFLEQHSEERLRRQFDWDPTGRGKEEQKD